MANASGYDALPRSRLTFLDPTGRSIRPCFPRKESPMSVAPPTLPAWRHRTFPTLPQPDQDAREASNDSRPQSIAMTASQKLLWTGQRLVPNAPLYNMVLVHRIEGALDPERLGRAFARLVEGSDALRIRVVDHPDAEATLGLAGAATLERLDGVGADGRSWSGAQGIQWAQERARIPIPVDGQNALVDGALVHLGPQRWLLYLGQHHLIADAWSASICLARLGELYAGDGGEGDPSGRPQFATFAASAAELEGRAAFGRARSYWESRPPAPPEGTGFYGGLRPARASARTDRVECPLGPERSRQLQALAKRPGIAGLSADLSIMQLFAVSLTALMQRVGAGHASQSILIPIHHRTTKALRETIGPLMEVLPARVDCAPGATFRSVYGSVRSEFHSLLRHALPGACAVANTRGVDVVLNYITARFGDFAGMPTRTTWIHPDHGDPSHGLRLQVHDFHGSGEFHLQFDMQCDVFGAAEREALPRHLCALIDGMLRDFDAEIQTVPLVSESELEELARGKADPDPMADQEPSVLAAFHARATEGPASVAIRERSGSGVWHDLSYGALRSRAQAFAAALRRRGIGPGDLVALHLPRSIDFAVAVLGTMESGAAYLPLDTASPAPRLGKVIADSSPVLLVVDPLSPLSERYPGQTATVADLEGEDPGTLASEAPCVRQNLAYVIYTSGSTGAPKGVEISHGALASYVLWARAAYVSGVEAGSPGVAGGSARVFTGEPVSAAFFSPTSVDLSVTSLFVPLCSGGTVHLYRETIGEHQGLVVLDVFEDDPADLIKLTPAHLALLLERGGKGYERLRTLVVGGENLTRSLALRAQDAFGERVAIFNEYGPTEATVGCLIHRFDGQKDAGKSVPIGRPIPGARAYIVDRHGGLLPPGVPGELWIGGQGLAEGYLGQPGLTEQRFRPDPFASASTPGARVYSTGDLVREDPATGLLVYLGRRDGQVKVQGVRIELGEVEAAIQEHPGVASSAAGLYRATAASGPRVRADAWDDVRYCARCGLASNHPDAHMEGHEVCAVCVEFDGYRDAAEHYFGTPDEMRALLGEPRGASGKAPDCMALLSGGKDSTYALYQLVEMGYTPLVFSLDNGYISEGAKGNIRRVVEHLGLELVMATTPSMNAIFKDSLSQFSNVCQGCFKTIFTLSTNLARERGITRIVTGLSRGQIFETRLAPIYRAGIRDPEEVDRYVLDAKRSYHRIDDAVSKHLDVSAFQSDAVFEDVQYVDFYRYHDVPLAEVLEFIGTRAAWRRPEDTGRSTNCLINDVGIRVHKEERGFHNYALPYSWDVRLGHKTRDECLDELNDDIDEERVAEILREVGGGPGSDGDGDQASMRLAGYYVPGEGAPSPMELREFLEQRLPAGMVPASLVPLEVLPLTESGKVDRARLPDPSGEAASHGPVPPSNATEHSLLEVWKGVLGLVEIGVEDHFLDLGGDSILSLQVVARARAAGLELSPRDVFDAPTVRLLSELAKPVKESTETVDEEGPVALSPIQRWYLDGDPEYPGHFAMSVVLRVDGAGASEERWHFALRSALAEVQAHHGALRLRVQRPSDEQGAGEWSAQVVPVSGSAAPVLFVLDGAATVDAAEQQLGQAFDLEKGPLLGAALIPGEAPWLVLAAHHMAVDAASWVPILEDFESAYGAALRGVPVALPKKSLGWRGWVQRARGRDSVPPLPGLAAGLEGEGESVVFRLGRAETERLLARESGSARTQDRLLAALAAAASNALGMSATIVDVEGFGRDLDVSPSSDVSRTVGWFTTLSRIRLDGADAEVALGQAAAARTRIPVKAPVEPATILFNYLGRGSSGQNGLVRSIARLRDGRARRTHGLDVHALVEDGVLELHVTFAARLCPPGRARAFGESMLAVLPRIVDLDPPAGAGGDADPSMADSAIAGSAFEGSGLSAADLDDLLSDFGDD